MPSFDDVVEQVRALLQSKGRVAYRTLKRRFDIDEDYIEDLKAEFIDAERIAVDEDGKVLVWVGNGEQTPDSTPAPSQTQTPASYTPQHLAERIRAEHAAMESRGSADGERKTITALFADLKGSTALIEGLDPEEARAIIDPALQLMMDAVHQYDGYVAQALGAELYRIKGELTLQQGTRDWKLGTASSSSQAPSLKPQISSEVLREAEECFLKAIAIAQKQQAKSLELRAVMSLARLWQTQGKHAEARQMLAEIYGWFMEGFDTKDLQEAKGLLEELTV